MANTYTNYICFRMPALGDIGWDDEVNDNVMILDFLLRSVLRSNCVISGAEVTDGGSLSVNIAAGEVYVAGSNHTIAADSASVTSGVKNFVFIDDTGAVQVTTLAPVGDYAALAMVDASGTAIDRIADLRFFAMDPAALDLDYAPSNYTPDTGQTKEIEQHLAGIDGALASGSGSGLDADTVDGLEASQFLRSDVDDDMAGDLNFSNGKGIFGKDTGSVDRQLLLINNSDQVIVGAANNPLALKGSENSASYNNATLWHEDNDGDGSGLDADTVDGVEANQLVRKDSSSVIASDISLEVGAGDGAVRLRHVSAGNLFYMAPFINSDWDLDKQITFDGDDGQWNIEGRPMAGGSTILTANDFMGGLKNRIINGGFDIWQRGTSQTAGGYGADDRWHNYDYGDGSFVCSQQLFAVGQTDVPDNPKYFSRTVVTAGTTTNSSIRKYQNIENVCLFSGETVTLSFWAKADAAKNIATRFVQYFGSGGTPSASIGNLFVTTHNLSTDWQEFTLTATMPSVSGKTLGTNNNDFTRIEFIFDAGSDYDDDSNSLGHQSGTFDISQVQLEISDIKTPFEKRHYAHELELCQRYYMKLGSTEAAAFGSTGNSNVIFFEVVLGVQLRDVPDVNISGMDFRFGGTSYTVSTADVTDIILQPKAVRIGSDVAGAGANTGGYTCINVGSAEFISEL